MAAKRRSVVVPVLVLAALVCAAGAGSAIAWKRARTPRLKVTVEDKIFFAEIVDEGRALGFICAPRSGDPESTTWHVFDVGTGRELCERHYPDDARFHSQARRTGNPLYEDPAGPVDLVDVVTGKRRTVLPADFQPRVGVALSSSEDLVALVTSAVPFSPGDPLAPVSSATVVELCTPAGAPIPWSRRIPGSETTDRVWWLEFSPEGDRVGVCVTTCISGKASGPDYVDVWSVADARLIRRIEGDLVGLTRGGGVLVRRDTTSIVLVGSDGSERAFARAAERKVALSSNGITVAMLEGEGEASSIAVRSVESGAVVRRIPWGRAGAPDLRLSPAGDLLAVTLGNVAEVWDLPPP